MTLMAAIVVHTAAPPALARGARDYPQLSERSAFLILFGNYLTPGVSLQRPRERWSDRDHAITTRSS